MVSKTIHSFLRSLHRTLHISIGLARGLSWPEVRALFQFARRRLIEERLPQVAGSLTFTSVLALVPLVTIALAIFTTFPLFNTFRTTLEAYFVQSVVPKAISTTILGHLTQFASKATRLSAVGAVALFFTSAAMMNMIERVFNQIWRVRRARPLPQRVLIYWTLVTLGPLLFGVSLTITSRLFMATSGVFGMVPFFGALFYTVVSVALTTGAFTLLYMAVPNRFVDWRDAAWGGLVAALAFEVAKRGFAAFIAQFPTYTIIYGALAAMPLFLLWIYLSWMITLVGALLVAALPVVKYERWWHEAVPGGDFVDAMAILKVLHGCAHVSDSALVSSATIRAHTRFGYDEMTKLLEQMLTLGWVGRVKVDVPKRVQWGKRVSEAAESWVLLANLEKLTLADVYRLFVFGAAGNMDALPETDSDAESPMMLDTGALARQVEAVMEQGLAQTLFDHFTKGMVATSSASRSTSAST